MRAIAVEGVGEQARLVVDDAALRPTVGAGQVLIRVAAAASIAPTCSSGAGSIRRRRTLRRGLAWTGATLRPRTTAFKAELAAALKVR